MLLLIIGVVVLSLGLYGWIQQRGYQASQDAQDASDGWERRDRYNRYRRTHLHCVHCDKCLDIVVHADFSPLWYLPTRLREAMLAAVIREALYNCEHCSNPNRAEGKT